MNEERKEEEKRKRGEKKGEGERERREDNGTKKVPMQGSNLLLCMQPIKQL